MADDRLMALPTFWERNQLSKVQYYYLKRIGRGPRETVIGTKVTINPDDERVWRLDMVERPVIGNLKKLAAEASLAAVAGAEAA
jgi:hypothetical protein